MVVIWQYARVILSICYTTFLGYAVVQMIFDRSSHRLSRVELLGYSFTVGLAVIAAGMLLLSAVKIPFSVMSILLLTLVPAGLLLIRRKLQRRKPSRSETPRLDVAFSCCHLLPSRLAVLLLVSVIAIVFVGSFLEPIAEHDPVAAWSFHAKIFFYERTALPTYFTSGMCGEFVSHWPPLVPLIQAWMHTAMGTYDDYKVKLIFPTVFLALLAVLYGTLTRYLSRSYTLSVLLLLAIPSLVVPFPGGSVASAYADVPFALFITAAACLLTSWVALGDHSHIILAGVLTAAAIWVKAEGLAFAVVSTVSVWIFWLISKHRHRRGTVAQPLIFSVILALSVVLIALYRSRLPGPFAPAEGEGQAVDLGRVFSPDFIVLCLQNARSLAVQSVNPARSGFLWIILVLLVTLRLRLVRRHIIAMPLLLIAGQIGSAVCFMAISGASPDWWAAVAVRRILLQIAPVITLSIGLLSAISAKRTPPETMSSPGGS
jgi:hypothetical protein